MKSIHLLTILLLSSFAASAQSYTWELDRRQAKVQEAKRKDSLAIAEKRFLYSSQLYVGTEFPIQIAGGYQFISQRGLAFHGSLGVYPSAFTRLLLNAAPADGMNADALDFIQDRLNNGSVIELGTGYYALKSGFYGLASVQFQQYSLSVTMNEIVENFGLDINTTDLESQLSSSPTLEDFYYGERVRPTFRPIQLVLSGGKLFRFRKLPHISIGAHLSYSLNLHTGFSIESNSFIGNIITSNFANSDLEGGDLDFGGGAGYPSLSIRLNYGFGEVVR